MIPSIKVKLFKIKINTTHFVPYCKTGMNYFLIKKFIKIRENIRNSFTENFSDQPKIMSVLMTSSLQLLLYYYHPLYTIFIRSKKQHNY